MADAIYTMGYAGRTASEVCLFIRRIRGTLVDIRYSPRSRMAEWDGQSLKKALGERYLHLQSLGNVNYRGDGPIQIADIAAGTRSIREIRRPVVLLCGCRDWQTCHRTVVAKGLRASGMQVSEITLDGEVFDGTEPMSQMPPAEGPKRPTQGSLF